MACPSTPAAIHGRSDLNVWWMRLGIQHQRIHPGCDDGIWSFFCNTVLPAKLDERDLILRD